VHNYKKIRALNYLRRNDEGASFFGLFEADDDKIYQVKFDQYDLKSNTKEFISNYISLIVNVPTPSAVFIYISSSTIDELNTLYSLNLSYSKNNYYFAVEWEEHVNDSWTGFNEFKKELAKVNNFNAFLSIYPFDQFFRNYDRHLGNHLISVKNNMFYFYLAIDADRIFASKWIERINEEISNFECFPYPFHQELYSIISDDEYKKLYIHSSQYRCINDSHQEELNNYLNEVFGVSSENIATIINFIEYRKDKIINACIQNSSCFEHVKNKSLPKIGE
jgi:hypothetical protein